MTKLRTVQVELKERVAVANRCQQGGDAKAALLDAVRQKLGFYSDRADGILLGFDSIKVLPNGFCVEDYCGIAVDAVVVYRVLRPRVGQLLEARVVKKVSGGRHAATCQVHPMVGAFVSGFKNDAWAKLQPQHSIVFRYECMEFMRSGYPSLKGSVASLESPSKKAKQRKH